MRYLDNVVFRQIRAAQLGLLAALLTVLAGPELTDLSTSVGSQVTIAAAAVGAALLVERRTRPGVQLDVQPARPTNRSW